MYINNSFSPIIRHLMNSKKVTALEISKLLNRSKKHTYIYLKNPTLLTIQQLYTLAGYFDIDYMELVYCLRKKQKKLTNEDKKTLLDIVEKYKDFD